MRFNVTARLGRIEGNSINHSEMERKRLNVSMYGDEELEVDIESKRTCDWKTLAPVKQLHKSQAEEPIMGVVRSNNPHSYQSETVQKTNRHGNCKAPDSMETEEQSDLATVNGKLTLWQFLLQLLLSNKHTDLIRWTNRQGEFILLQAEGVAKLWGLRKDRNHRMNYDKLSRALRYYYEKNIIRKVHGHKFVYQFIGLNQLIKCCRHSFIEENIVPSEEEIKREQSSSSEVDDRHEFRTAWSMPEDDSPEQNMNGDVLPTSENLTMDRQWFRLNESNQQIENVEQSADATRYTSLPSNKNVFHKEPYNDERFHTAQTNLTSVFKSGSVKMIQDPNFRKFTDFLLSLKSLSNSNHFIAEKSPQISPTHQESTPVSGNGIPRGSRYISSIIHRSTSCCAETFSEPIIQNDGGMVDEEDNPMTSISPGNSVFMHSRLRTSAADESQKTFSNPDARPFFSQSDESKRNSSRFCSDSPNLTRSPSPMCNCSCHHSTPTTQPCPDSSNTVVDYIPNINQLPVPTVSNTKVRKPESRSDSPTFLHNQRHAINMQRLYEQLARVGRTTQRKCPIGQVVPDSMPLETASLPNSLVSPIHSGFNDNPNDITLDDNSQCVWMPVPITMLTSWFRLLSDQTSNDTKDGCVKRYPD